MCLPYWKKILVKGWPTLLNYLKWKMRKTKFFTKYFRNRGEKKNILTLFCSFLLTATKGKRQKRNKNRKRYKS